MSVIEIPATCQCGGLLPGLRRCQEHKHIFRDSKRLASVSSVLKLWPQKPCACGAISYDTHAADCKVLPKIENAQRRGREVDDAFCAWLTGKFETVTAGAIGSDSAELLKKLVKWFNKRGAGAVECQVLLGDHEIGGVCDLWIDGIVYELKCTYEISDTHILQAAAYHELINVDSARVVRGYEASGAAILHVTERYAEPRVIPLTNRDFDDWKTLREYWTMVQRRQS